MLLGRPFMISPKMIIPRSVFSLESSFQLDGSSSFAILAKWRSYYQDNPDTAPVRLSLVTILTSIANNLVGTAYANTLNVRPSDTAITYDIVFAIPALIILSIWVPVLVSLPSFS
ncbi:hypothetical protein BT69DRAFT_233610 [Atractiella rhizophila]|nr:hypothetical protein BT69DRAFT_233610 [Atractiella rhizophila]